MEHTAYLSAEEVEAAQALHKRAPYAISGISQGIFSLARCGGMTYQGERYTYIPVHDECVRDDVFKMVQKMRRAKERISKADNAARQSGFELDEA